MNVKCCPKTFLLLNFRCSIWNRSQCAIFRQDLCLTEFVICTTSPTFTQIGQKITFSVATTPPKTHCWRRTWTGTWKQIWSQTSLSSGSDWRLADSALGPKLIMRPWTIFWKCSPQIVRKRMTEQWSSQVPPALPDPNLNSDYLT